MIVKKVPPSKFAAPKSLAANVRDLADYIAGPAAGGDGEKVEHRGGLNFLADDHDGQVQEMVDLAEAARRDAKPVQHWILSWREGEQPTPAQADEAVKMFLGEMDLAEHQAIYALHSDTHNWHLHLAVNRVHPDTEKLVTVNKGYDHKVAHRAIARIELRQRWEPEARALYAPDGTGDLKLVKRPDGDRQPSAPALALEERVGVQSAQRIGIQDAAPLIRRAGTWAELHEALRKAGMRFEKKGSGALLWIGDRPVKASVAGRDCSMSALRKRLGDFEPAPTPAPPLSKTITSRPLDPAAPLLASYLEQRGKFYEERARRAQQPDRQRAEWRQLADRHRKERADMFRGSWKGKRDALNALRSLTAARQAQEKAALRERQKLDRAARRHERGRFPSYEEWLARSDRDAADEWRHRGRRPATIEGSTFDPPVPRDIRAVKAVLAGDRVHYYLPNSRSSPAFTDRGKSIDIHGDNREAVLAALQLSDQKWGAFWIRGDARFKQTCAELAAEHGFKITNPELQQAIAAERHRLRRSKQPDAPERQDGQRPTSMTPAAIYQRHLAAIVRERADRQADPSRFDAEAAVRLAVTGHSREQIVDAIRDGASASRPTEKRDWDTYARRAADFAFSPPGREMRESLAGFEQKFLRLEGREDERSLLRKLGGPMKYL
ncbi:MAG TPA: TraI/MobA(P) family conjugative relaxase [Polyangia bacterium]|nr:TraI/MobA(P) family conjugative relaxase [Polyangia bacterium]